MELPRSSDCHSQGSWQFHTGQIGFGQSSAFHFGTPVATMATCHLNFQSHFARITGGWRLAKKNGNQQKMNRLCIKRSNFAARTNALKWHFEVTLPPILSRSARRRSRFRASEDAKALYLAPLKATRVTWPQAITVIWFHGVPGIMSREGAWLEGNIWWTWRSHELSWGWNCLLNELEMRDMTLKTQSSWSVFDALADSLVKPWTSQHDVAAIPAPMRWWNWLVMMNACWAMARDEVRFLRELLDFSHIFIQGEPVLSHKKRADCCSLDFQVPHALPKRGWLLPHLRCLHLRFVVSPDWLKLLVFLEAMILRKNYQSEIFTL